MSGGHTLTEAKLKLSQLKNALLSATFPLKKITSNHKSLLEHVAREDLLYEEFLSLDYAKTIKTLGIRWEATSNSFYYIVKPIDSAATTTKRQILSAVAKLFDPLGWLGPIVILAKLLVQQLWEAKLDSDEAVPVKIHVKWKLFCDHLHRLHSLRLPRWIIRMSHSTTRLQRRIRESILWRSLCTNSKR